MPAPDFEVLIAGAGPAGLSGALLLGRCRRRVLLCGVSGQRNRSSRAIHGLLGSDGTSPHAYLEAAHNELLRYPTVEARHTNVTGIEALGAGFSFKCCNGTCGTASKILLATGIVDELPSIPSIEMFYGTSVHHCLYCDGFEHHGHRVAAYGRGDKAAALALMMKHWIPDVVCCSDGVVPCDRLFTKLQKHEIPLRAEPIVGVQGYAGRLEEILFAEGTSLRCDAMFFATGSHQGSDLAERLGCRRDEKGGVITDPATEETSVPGVYVAGDVSRDVLLVAIAVAEGAKSAVAINKAFLRIDGLCE